MSIHVLIMMGREPGNKVGSDLGMSCLVSPIELTD